MVHGHTPVEEPEIHHNRISIHSGAGGLWYAALRQSPDGPEIAVTPADFARREDAWQAAFELYRSHFVT